MSKTNSVKHLLFILVVGILGLGLFIMFYPPYDDFSSLKLTVDQSAAIEKSKILASKLNIDVTDKDPSVSLRRQDNLLEDHQKKYGLKETAKKINENLPGYYWRISYSDLNVNPDSVSTTQAADDNQKSLSFEISTTGQLISINNQLADSQNADEFGNSHEESSRYFLQQFTPYDSSKWTLKNREFELSEKDSIYRFSWFTSSVDWTDTLMANIEMQGKSLGKLTLEPLLPKRQDDEFDIGDLFEAIEAIFIMVMIIFAIVVLIRRLRQDKIDFRMSLVMAIITAVMMAMLMFPSMNGAALWQLLLGTGVSAAFVGFAGFILTGVSESVARDIWNEKLFTLDNLVRGKLLSNRNGHALLSGLGFAGIMLGVFLVSVVLSEKIVPVWTNHDDPENFISASAWIGNLGEIWLSTVFIYFGFIVLIFSLLRSVLNKVWLLYVLCSLIFALIPLQFVIINPTPIPNITQFIFGIIITIALFRYDFLAVLVALLSYVSILHAMPYFSQGSFSFVTNGLVTCLFPIGFLVLGLISLNMPESTDQKTEYTPAYLRRISERERFQRELEIARTVQLKFLPDYQPQSDWLDVASTCVPAYEVGGDYYDFLELDHNRLGVVVGDVSGKGVSAAFFMTLLKGILVSQTRHTQSPRDVLVQMNDLFYDNAQRGVFISVIYGVFDRLQGTFTYARAGHNPVIVHNHLKEDAKELCPNGMALGLDKGPIFADTLEEVSVKVNPGDVFVFYTDGFSEAMDNSRQEFGENRLLEAIKTSMEKSASEILEDVQVKVKHFTGDTPQHDDMTMVVVRVADLLLTNSNS